MLRVVVLLVALVGVAQAKGFRRGQVPNGTTLSCLMCHVDGQPKSVRNVFGEQVADTLVGEDANWAALFDLDADGDGFTNGEELGDPEGVWQPGQPNPPYVSHPADLFDHPPEPCMFVAEPDAALEAPDMAAVEAPDMAALEVDAAGDDAAEGPPAEIGINPVNEGGGGGDSGGCQGVPAPWPWLPLLLTLRRSPRARRPRSR